MKKNENYPKYVQAMHLLDEGKTANHVARTLKIGMATLRLARQRYLAGGELELLQPAHKPHHLPETKERIIQEIAEKGLSLYRASLVYGVPSQTLGRWQRSYQKNGLAGFVRSKSMKKKRQRTEAELDELEMLRKRNEYLEAENALLKKVKALVEEREARLRAIGRKPSKD